MLTLGAGVHSLELFGIVYKSCHCVPVLFFFFPGENQIFFPLEKTKKLKNPELVLTMHVEWGRVSSERCETVTQTAKVCPGPATACGISLVELQPPYP